MSRWPIAALVVLATAVLASPSEAAKRRWYALGSGTVEMGGDVYPKAWYQSSATRTEFNIRRKCTKLSYFAGITDDSDAESEVEVTVTGEGGEIATYGVTFGDVQRRFENVRGVLRLGFETTPIAGSYTYVGFGRVRAFCTKAPTPL
jgi:hypothetical protein